jgi:hypothetical protein
MTELICSTFVCQSSAHVLVYSDQSMSARIVVPLVVAQYWTCCESGLFSFWFLHELKAMKDMKNTQWSLKMYSTGTEKTRNSVLMFWNL